MSRKTLYVGMTGGFGSLAQVIPILEQLNPDKYRVLCSINHGAAHAVKRLGYEFVPYPDVGEPSLVTPKGRHWCQLDQYWGRFGFADHKYFLSLIQARLALVEELAPDILLTQFCPPTEVIARITGIPIICVTQSCWHPKGKALCWWKHVDLADYPPVTPIVNSVLERYAALPVRCMADLNQGDLTLIPSFPEFDPINDKRVHYIGPQRWESAQQILVQKIVPMFDDKKPLIVVYTGHLYDSAGESGILILREVLKALKNTAVNVLIATGLGQEHTMPVCPYPHVHIHEWLPMERLLKRCALFIHHGGHGSCMAGIVNQAPALIIPTFQEREFNARQLHRLGLADFIMPSDLQGGALALKITSCLQDRSIGDNLAAWQVQLSRRQYGGAPYAATLIDHLAGD